MTLTIGSILHNRYKIEEIIAQGGMGAIYKATDQSLGVSVAIKENLYPSDDSTRQFRREATILAGLRHPNLPRVTDHFVIPDQGQYLVMDYIDGLDLRSRLDQEGPLPESEVVRIGIAICDALAHLHNRAIPIVHRDIKPGNIKITSNGSVFLVDFGLAKFSQAGVATTTGAQALTPGYAPPEQYGQGTEPRSDIYALGASLYAMLTNQLPEDGLARAMGDAELSPIAKFNPSVSQELTEIIEKAMAVRPEDRFQSADEFKQALIALLPPAQDPQEEVYFSSSTVTVASRQGNGETITSYAGPAAEGYTQVSQPRISPQPSPAQSAQAPFSQSAPPQVSQPVKKKKLPIWIGAIIGIGLLGICSVGGFLAWKGLQSPKTIENPQPAIMYSPMVTADVSSALPVVTQTIAPVPTNTLSPTGTSEPTLTFTPSTTPAGGGGGKIAFASDRNGLPQIFTMNSDGSNPVQITTFTDGACQPDWSPDGSKIVFISPCKERKDIYKGSGLFIAEADGTGVTPLISVPGGDYEPDWSPDGNRIAFTSLRDGISHIYLYDIQANTATLLSAPTSNDRRPDWSPDGSKIVFETTRLGNSQVWVMNDTGKGAREFANLNNGASYMPTWSPSGQFISFVQGTDQPWLTSREYGNSSAPEIKLQDLRSIWNPQYSPDNFWFVFEYIQEGNLDIYRMSSNGAMLTRLTEEEGADFNPAWQPSKK